jgi:hypothetical protein
MILPLPVLPLAGGGAVRRTPSEEGVKILDKSIIIARLSLFTF